MLRGHAASVTGVDTSVAAGPPEAPVLDVESRRWLDELGAEGLIREQAVERLHQLLLRAARFELNRRRHQLRPADLDDLALQAADDALVSVLERLDRFRGASRFTTWAYKFALLEAAVGARRVAWQRREIPLEPEGWLAVAGSHARPERDAQQGELLRILREGIAVALTPHQRDVLVAIVGNDVPIDVLAERLGTTRGALYKTLHDARAKLRVHVAAAGYAEGVDDVA
jgi:RNA polymerase sigma-70 factor (ECF subfamily)